MTLRTWDATGRLMPVPMLTIVVDGRKLARTPYTAARAFRHHLAASRAAEGDEAAQHAAMADRWANALVGGGYCCWCGIGRLDAPTHSCRFLRLEEARAKHPSTRGAS